MVDAVIVSTARTGLAKSWRGAFNMTHGASMGGHVVRHALERARQTAHNLAEGITPTSVVKRVKEMIDGIYNDKGAKGDLKAAPVHKKTVITYEYDPSIKIVVPGS